MNAIVGVNLAEPTANETAGLIVRAEQAGVPAYWLTIGPQDPMIIFAAAAARTSSILLGTSIVPTFPRHPLALAMQAIALAQLAPGRFRLGVGPSHQPTMENTWGIPFERPLAHLREYVSVLRAALTTGEVATEGPRFRVHTRIANPPQVPIMVSALREASFRLAGEIADGAISWVSPAAYLKRDAIPAIEAGARKAGREPPPLVAHCFIVVDEDLDAVRTIAQQRAANYPRLPFYASMFESAGYSEARDGILSDRMIDAIVMHGNEEQVTAGLQTFADAGASEIIATVLPTDANREASIDRAFRAIGRLAR
ncbi:MAG TPA: LLM class flavin-dependent oxidoreductase [Dehalococcoidia bacterium]|nr:LLM class flavin-dependent oxidoreductase [Dehalococcoidia bacterium]